MKVDRARFPPTPKFCDQCAATLLPPREGDGAICCPNAAVCKKPPYWGPQSQVVAGNVIRVRDHDGRVGVLTVQHNGRDDWELPFGFNPLGESSDECAGRETEEEATYEPDMDRVIHADFETVSEGHLLAFHVPEDIIDVDDLPAFVPNNEKQARKICHDWRELRFSTHQQAVRDALGGRFDNWPKRIPAPL